MFSFHFFVCKVYCHQPILLVGGFARRTRTTSPGKAQDFRYNSFSFHTFYLFLTYYKSLNIFITQYSNTLCFTLIFFKVYKWYSCYFGRRFWCGPSNCKTLRPYFTFFWNLWFTRPGADSFQFKWKTRFP